MKMKYLILLIICTNAQAGINDQVYGDVMVSEVTDIYDADTFRVNVHGWPGVIGANMPIRILGIDAPEIRGKCPEEKAAAKRARLFTVNFLKACSKIELRGIRRGSFFRIVVSVYVDGKSLGDALIMAGHARFYSGKGKRLSWCGK